MVPGPACILVVDDEEMLCSIMCDDLDDFGYKTIPAHCGDEARAIMERGEVDLILSDVRMPRGDGVSVLKAARALSPAPPVFFTSGCTGFSPEEAYDMGVEALFNKPLDIEELTAAVQRALGEWESRWPVPTGDMRGLLEVRHGELTPEALSEGEGVRLGRGGLFVPAPEGGGVEVDQRVAIDLAFVEGSRLEGVGIVRWCRKSAGTGSPGFGVEFAELAAGSVAILRKLLAGREIRAYIPLG